MKKKIFTLFVVLNVGFLGIANAESKKSCDEIAMEHLEELDPNMELSQEESATRYLDTWTGCERGRA